MSQIKITNASIKGTGGSITDATIEGEAEISPPEVPPGTGDEHPAHPILLPPGEAPEGSFWLLCYCPNPPPPHWEWILFTPGSPPERPQPHPPEPPEIGEGLPDKPFPPDGGWGYQAPWGWIYWPGPKGAGPKARK